MRIMALVIAAASAALLAMLTTSQAALPVYVGISGLILAGVVWFSRDISTFLRVFVFMYGIGFLLICAGHSLQNAGLLPASALPFLPPSFMATACAAFAAIVFGVSFLPIIRTITGLADPYFHSTRPATEAYGFFGKFFGSEGAAAQALVGVIIAENFGQVAMTIKLNVWYRDLFDALQKKNAEAFWEQIWYVFVPLLVIWILVQLFDVTLDTIFQLRWREWLTRNYFTRWLSDGTHYKMGLAGFAADNPDQRIAADVDSFLTRTMSLSIRLLSQLATLVSFTVILWGLSKDFTVPFTAIAIPGLLFWVAAAYAIIGTVAAHFIGRPLIRLDFLNERYEANFRFALARLREYGEQIALLNGAVAEINYLRKRFTEVIRNSFAILFRRLKLTGFTFAWSQMSVAFPYIFMGAYYFADKMTLGEMQQGSSAFGRVEGALAFFMASYATLAAYKATIDRLTSFREAMGKAETIGVTPPHIAVESRKTSSLDVEALTLRLPDGRAIVRVHRLSLAEGEPVLLGPVGLGQVHLLPRARRHLALWRWRDPRARGAQRDAVAAAAVSAAWNVARRALLSIDARRLSGQ